MVRCLAPYNERIDLGMNTFYPEQFCLGYPTAFLMKISMPNFVRYLLHDAEALTLFGSSKLGVSGFTYEYLIDLATFIFPEIVP